MKQNEYLFQRIQESLLEVCQEHYKSGIDVELDAIICLRKVDSDHSDVVKVHRIVPKDEFHSSLEGIIDFNQEKEDVNSLHANRQKLIVGRGPISKLYTNNARRRKKVPMWRNRFPGTRNSTDVYPKHDSVKG